MCLNMTNPKPFYLARDRKQLAGALEQRLVPDRRLIPTGRPGEYGTRWKWETTKQRKPKPGGHWVSYWSIRNSATGKTAVWFGRDFDPSHPIVERVLWEHGILPEDAKAAMKSRRRPRLARRIAKAARVLNQFRGLAVNASVQMFGEPCGGGKRVVGKYRTRIGRG